MHADILTSWFLGWIVGGIVSWFADTLPNRGTRESGLTNWLPQFYHNWTLWWYPFRRGMCPHCGERRPLRAPLLEFGMALAFAVQWWLFGANLSTLIIAWGYTAFLLMVLVIDIEHRRVLNVMTMPALAVVFALSFLPATPDPQSALLGGLVGFGMFLAIAVITKMGAGDVKLAGVIGLMLGYPNVVTALLLGMILGGLGALVLLLSRRAGRKSYMAYAPYLSVGALIILIQTLGQ